MQSLDNLWAGISIFRDCSFLADSRPGDLPLGSFREGCERPQPHAAGHAPDAPVHGFLNRTIPGKSAQNSTWAGSSRQSHWLHSSTRETSGLDYCPRHGIS